MKRKVKILIGILIISTVLASAIVSSTDVNETLLPLPYHAYDRIPKPGAKDVPVTTSISITFSRPPGIVELEMEPEVEISHISKEMVGVASGKFTFYLAEPLLPETTYTVKITYGQEEAPEGFSPTSTDTWQFTTGPEATATPLIPGFEAVFTIVGLLAVAYFVQRRNKSK